MSRKILVPEAPEEVLRYVLLRRGMMTPYTDFLPALKGLTLNVSIVALRGVNPEVLASGRLIDDVEPHQAVIEEI